MTQTIALIVGIIVGILFARSNFSDPPTPKEALVALSSAESQDLASLETNLSKDQTSDATLLAMLACIQARKAVPSKDPMEQQISMVNESPRPTEAQIPDSHKKPPSASMSDQSPSTANAPADHSPPVELSPAEVSRPSNYYRDTYPPARIRIPRSEKAGFVDTENVDIQSFLKSRRCENPATATLSETLMGESLFFQAVRTQNFSLSLRTDKGGTFKGSIYFQTDETKFRDRIKFFASGSGNPVDDRTLTYPSTHGAWRLNSCKPGIILLGTHCPWSQEKKFSQEFKDLYYLAQTQQLVGNVYCKNPSDAKWTFIGTLEPNPL